MKLQYSANSTQTRFVNLRHAQNGLTAVGQPEWVEVEENSKLLLSIGDIDILYSSGSMVAANHETETVETFDEVASEPRAAIELSPGCFTVFMDDDRVSYSIDEDGSVKRLEEPVVPTFSVVGSALQPVSSRVSAVALSRKYSASESRLDPVDVDRVSAAFLGAIGEATAGAWSRSRFVAPVVARCRVEDENRRTVFVGPEVLVNPLAGVDIMPIASWSVGSDFTGLATSTVDIDSFGLELKTFAGAASPGLSVVVEVINRVSLIDFDRSAMCSISRNGTGNASLTVRAQLLTAEVEMQRMVAAMLAEGDEMYVPFARVENLFDGSEKRVALQPDKPYISASSPREIARQFKRRLELGAYREPSAVESLRLPHRFVATVASKNGSAILYGNPEVVFFEGYQPTYFVASESGRSGEWRAKATVEFDGGERVGVAVVESMGDVPLKLSPVIGYPSRRATAMTIEVGLIGGPTWRRRFELTALSGRDMAIYINDELKEIDLSASEVAGVETERESDVPRLKMDGAIVTASAEEPYVAIDVMRNGDGEVRAIAPVVCSPRGLEQRRNRFYLFGSEGIKMVTLSDKRRVVNIVLTDRRGVESADCVAVDGTGRVIVLTTSGHLVALSGASAVTLDRVEGRGIVADNIKGEIWILSNSPDEAIVRDMTAGDYYRRTIDGRVESVLNMTSWSSMLIGNRLIRVGRERSDLAVKIEATVKVEDSVSTIRRLPAMFLFRFGSVHAESGLVTAAPDDLSGNSRGGATRSRLFSGVVGREILLPVNFNRSESYTAHLEARVAPGSVFSGVKIMYKR